MVAQDLEDALGVITDDEEDRRGADRRVILVQARLLACASQRTVQLVDIPRNAKPDPN